MIINTNNIKPKKHLEEKETKNEKRSLQALVLLIFCIALIITIIAFTIYRSYRSNFNYMKEEKSEHLIYTRYKQNKKTVPYINIKSKSVKSVNNDIVDFCNNFVELEDANISYDYNISGNYLSLVIKVINNGTEYAPKVYFRTYTINLVNRSYMNDKTLLKYFKVTEEEASNKINEQLLSYYNEEQEQGYIEEQECDFNCFLKYREIENYLDEVNYYIKDGKLIAFKPFVFSSILGEEEYFTDESFEFKISE